MFVIIVFFIDSLHHYKIQEMQLSYYHVHNRRTGCHQVSNPFLYAQ